MSITFNTDTLHTALAPLEQVTLGELAYIIMRAYQQMQADVCYLFFSPDIHQALNEPAWRGCVSPSVSLEHFQWDSLINLVTGTRIHIAPLVGFPPGTVGLGWFTPKEIAHE